MLHLNDQNTNRTLVLAANVSGISLYQMYQNKHFLFLLEGFFQKVVSKHLKRECWEIFIFLPHI